MSKGKILKPRNTELPANLTDKPIKDVIYTVVQTCEVEVDNTEWQNADKKITDNLGGVEAKIADIEKRLGANHGNLSEEISNINKQIAELKSRRPLDLVVTINDKRSDLGVSHRQLPDLIEIVSTGLNVYLVGPAGSGKTMAAIKCAEALGVPFHFTGAIASEYKLTGFIDAQGRIVSTEFRKAYEHGGLFLFDEIDASYPQAVLAFNAALANDYMDFPDKRISRHEKFYCIAAANTYGQGADRQYVGRNQLDAASLDRFVFVDWKYDENLERSLAGNDEWTAYVQRVRKCIENLKIRHIVSPRSSIFGAKLLAKGIMRETVENTIIWKGIDEATKQKIIANLYPKEKIKAPYSGTFTSKLKPQSTVKKGQKLGDIEYRDQRSWDYKTQAIHSEFDGVVLSIISNGSIEKESIIAEIQLP